MLQKNNKLMESNHEAQNKITQTYVDMQKKLIDALNMMYVLSFTTHPIELFIT